MMSKDETKDPIKHDSIVAALAAAQAEMGRAIKESNNPHFRSKYADLGNVMDACMPALNKHGIALVQPTLEDENGRYVETVLMHMSGQELRCRVPLIVSKNDMQGYGSAVTYARRYGLMTMAGIAPEDDDGNAASKSPPKNEQRRKPASTPDQSGHSSQDQPQQPQGPTAQDQAVQDKLIQHVQHHENDGYQRDLEALRRNAPELAAQVDVEIENYKAVKENG